MIEIICILVIVGIIGVFAITRMTSTQDIDLASQIEVVKTHLRQAQARAMSSGRPWGIFFHSNKKRYYLFDDAANTTKVLLLGEKNAEVDLQQDKNSALRIDPPSGNRVTFNAYGSPGTANIVLTTNGGNITITKNTGFIP